MSKKKRIIIMSAILFVVLLAGAATAYLLVQDHNRKQYELYVSTSLAIIAEWGNQFNTSENHERRVFLYRGLSDLHAEYSGRETNNDEIIQKYENTLSIMESFLFDWYTGELSKIESIEATGQTSDKITAYTYKVNNLNSVKALVDSDNVFTGDNRHNQLHDKADGLISYYTDTAEWFVRTDDINDRFNSTDRAGKFGIFNEFTEMHLEYEESVFTHNGVAELLDSSRENKTQWFYHWYDSIIDELSYHSIVWRSDCDNCADNDDCDDCDNCADNDNCEECDICVKVVFPGFDTEGEEEDEGEDKKPWDYLILAMIELNDLIVLFGLEGEVIFVQSEVNQFNSKLDTALLGNLNSLEALGVEIISNMEFRSEAAEMALERYNELFEEWKDGYKDNDHLRTYPEILQEAIELGQEEHDRILEAERREAARTRSHGGGNLFRTTCIGCGASAMLPNVRHTHRCGTDIWEREDGRGSSDTRVRRSVGDSFIAYDMSCPHCYSPARLTVTAIHPWGYEVSDSRTCSCD